MKQKKSRLRQFHNKNHGFTLVEMIVSFSLIGLFMVAATKVIISTSSIYYEAKGTENGMQVCSILTAKIRKEVEGATTDKLTKTDRVTGAAEQMDYAILMGEDSTVDAPNIAGLTIPKYKGYKIKCTGLQLTNADNCHIYIAVNKYGYLDIYYYGGESTGSASESGVAQVTSQTHWTLDKNTYLGYIIESLTFEKPPSGYNSNVICMKLTVYSPRYGRYSTTEYIECYNFEKDTNLIGTEQ